MLSPIRYRSQASISPQSSDPKVAAGGIGGGFLASVLARLKGSVPTWSSWWLSWAKGDIAAAAAEDIVKT
jgi:hypothetical protein